MNEEVLTHGNKKETYSEFVNKFTIKKTTDECYTPPEVYQEVKEYVIKNYSVPEECIIRPFYPGGDYQSIDYSGKIVVDNPPFSKMSEILKFYHDNNVGFFLFANKLTCFNCERHNYKFGYVFVVPNIVYENGASVPTCFIHNFDNLIKLDGQLLYHSKAPKLRKLSYPENQKNGARMKPIKNEVHYLEHYGFIKDMYGGGVYVREESKRN